MNYADLPTKLARIVNLRDFAIRSGIPRRTLYTVMQLSHSPSLKTCERIARALRELKPEMRKGGH